MGYHRKLETNKRLKKLYCSTRNKVSGGVYYGREKGRYIRYYLYKKGNFKCTCKRLSNKRVRKSSYIKNRAGYKRVLDYLRELN